MSLKSSGAVELCLCFRYAEIYHLLAGAVVLIMVDGTLLSPNAGPHPSWMGSLDPPTLRNWSLRDEDYVRLLVDLQFSLGVMTNFDFDLADIDGGRIQIDQFETDDWIILNDSNFAVDVLDVIIKTQLELVPLDVVVFALFCNYALAPEIFRGRKVKLRKLMIFAWFFSIY